MSWLDKVTCPECGATGAQGAVELTDSDESVSEDFWTCRCGNQWWQEAIT